MGTWTLEWQSTAQERYDTDMNGRAKRAIHDAGGVKIVGEFGGTDLQTQVSDNGFDIEADEVAARRAAKAVTREVGHPATVTKVG